MVNRGLVASLAVAVALAACGGGSVEKEVKPAPSTTVATSPPTAPDPAALTMGQRADTREGNTVQMYSYVQPVVGGLLEADAGREYAAVEAEICAGPRGARRVTPDAIAVEMPDGTRRGRSYFGPKEPALDDARLEGGACTRGWVSFEVPADTRPAHVVFEGSSVIRWSTGTRTR